MFRSFMSLSKRYNAAIRLICGFLGEKRKSVALKDALDIYIMRARGSYYALKEKKQLLSEKVGVFSGKNAAYNPMGRFHTPQGLYKHASVQCEAGSGS